MSYYEIIMLIAGLAIGYSVAVAYYEPKLHRRPKADTTQTSAPARSDHDSFFDQYSAKPGVDPIDYGYHKPTTDEDW